MASTYWDGTWLSVSMIAQPEARLQWATLVQRWAAAGLLSDGEALLIAADPKRITYSNSLDPEYLPKLSLGRQLHDVLSVLQTSALSHLLLRRSLVSPFPEIRIDQQVNPDESLTLSLSAPLSLFEMDSIEQIRNFQHFLETARSVFWARFFLAGTVAEEARIGSLGALRQDIESWSGRAFYGSDLALLTTADPRPAGWDEPAEWVELADNGLYVSWSPWPHWAPCPPLWRDRLMRALEVLNV